MKQFHVYLYTTCYSMDDIEEAVRDKADFIANEVNEVENVKNADITAV